MAVYFPSASSQLRLLLYISYFFVPKPGVSSFFMMVSNSANKHSIDVSTGM